MAPIAVEPTPVTLPVVTKGPPTSGSGSGSGRAAPAPAPAAAANTLPPGEDAGPDTSHLTPAQLEELARLSAISESKLPVDWNPEYKYKWALPWFDERYKADFFKDPPLEPFEHTDVGLRALSHADPQAFLKKDDVQLDHLSPRFGTVVRGSGVDLTKLTSDELDELALYVAERGVVVFEGNQQAFIDQTPEQLKAFGWHFSPRLHKHQVSGQPKGHAEFHLVYKAGKTELNNYEHRMHYVPTVFHSDVSFEANPPGVTTLFLFETPETGGDTLFSDSEELLRRLSPTFRAFLETLSAEHSGHEQSANAKASGQGVVKREPVAHVHPVVRTHPVTGRQSLYVNKGFTKRIVGLKREESDAILNVLFQLNADAIDAHVRVRWRKNTVVIWDNRRGTHSPIVDFEGDSARRHGARITPAAERPFFRKSAE